jgi:hypothetical protein
VEIGCRAGPVQLAHQWNAIEVYIVSSLPRLGAHIQPPPLLPCSTTPSFPPWQLSHISLYKTPPVPERLAEKVVTWETHRSPRQPPLAGSTAPGRSRGPRYTSFLGLFEHCHQLKNTLKSMSFIFFTTKGGAYDQTIDLQSTGYNLQHFKSYSNHIYQILHQLAR